MTDESHESHRPPAWPDQDEDFKTHDNAASWWLMVLAFPLLIAAVVVALYWVL